MKTFHASSKRFLQFWLVSAHCGVVIKTMVISWFVSATGCCNDIMMWCCWSHMRCSKSQTICRTPSTVEMFRNSHFSVLTVKIKSLSSSHHCCQPTSSLPVVIFFRLLIGQYGFAVRVILLVWHAVDSTWQCVFGFHVDRYVCFLKIKGGETQF